jgi:magnesium-transporting ATPase (P-type)
LDTFRGVLSLNQDPKAEILTINNFVMHLSKLKNIKWAIGIAVYTGKHTKINMNSDWHIRKSNFALVFINKFNYLMIFFVGLLAVVRNTKLFHL